MADNNSSINSVSSNSDQHQISPNNVTTQSREKFLRINEMITKRKMLRSVIKFSQLILVEVYGDKCGEFVCGYEA